MASPSLATPRELGFLAAGPHAVEGVRRAVTDPLRHGLAPLLDRCLPDGVTAARPRLLRTKYKPNRKLTAYYAMQVPDHRSQAPRHLAVTWSVAPADPAETAEPSLLEEAAYRRGVAAPFRRLAATSPDGCVSLAIAPVDPAFPRLVGLYAAADDVTTVRFRPGQRHVLRVVMPPPDAGVAFVKAYRDGTGERAVAVAQAWDALLADGCPGVRTARVLRYAAADRAVWWAGEPGEPLWRCLTDGTAVRRLPRLVGQALRVLHEHTPEQVLPHYETATEIATTIRASGHIGLLLPPVGERLRRLISRVVACLDQLPTEPPRLTHGDLKCDNLLSTGVEVRAIDLDRAAIADPALDLGKFIADLRWWCALLGADAEVAVAAFLEGYVEQYSGCGLDRLARARALAALFQVKLVARRVAVHDPAWAVLVSRGMDLAEVAV
ncbi:phosphotransferase family protein [Actinopolymorpha alba]|uniref:phosphotransferase family protein n=1 Tax=Actinopolymorpha alba TaxID=533267 RepID=UPI00037AB1AE|nr:aminoglycoside phosphotransferase family protein [Actinopolymorpha alba]